MLALVAARAARRRGGRARADVGGAL